MFLREQLIAELEEKQKMIEAERYSMELTGDSMDLKPITTRKLRRRANESASKILYYTYYTVQGGPSDVLEIHVVAREPYAVPLLCEQLIAELEEKQKMIEAERYSM